MSTIADDDVRVIAGVDTHKDFHVVVVLDELGRKLDTATFATTTRGYRDLTGWVTGFGEVLAIGVEGTASWGAGLSRHLRERGLNVIEVNQPDRHRRRRRGKSDRLDAEMAARIVLAGDATALPKAGDGPVEALRQLRLARSGAIKARAAAANQLHSVCDTAPDQIRARLRGLTTRRKVKLAARFRPGDPLTPTGGTKRALVTIARRWIALDAEIAELDLAIKHILDAIADCQSDRRVPKFAGL
jgi:transposase